MNQDPFNEQSVEDQEQSGSQFEKRKPVIFLQKVGPVQVSSERRKTPREKHEELIKRFYDLMSGPCSPATPADELARFEHPIVRPESMSKYERENGYLKIQKSESDFINKDILYFSLLEVYDGTQLKGMAFILTHNFGLCSMFPCVFPTAKIHKIGISLNSSSPFSFNKNDLNPAYNWNKVINYLQEYANTNRMDLDFVTYIGDVNLGFSGQCHTTRLISKIIEIFLNASPNLKLNLNLFSTAAEVVKDAVNTSSKVLKEEVIRLVEREQQPFQEVDAQANRLSVDEFKQRYEENVKIHLSDPNGCNANAKAFIADRMAAMSEFTMYQALNSLIEGKNPKGKELPDSLSSMHDSNCEDETVTERPHGTAHDDTVASKIEKYNNRTTFFTGVDYQDVNRLVTQPNAKQVTQPNAKQVTQPARGLDTSLNFDLEPEPVFKTGFGKASV